MTPQISVIIPSYNHERFVLKTIRSVLDQTFKDFEVIIVDDGSTDRSCELIQGIYDPRVRWIFRERNYGACAAVNMGIKESSAPLIAICNSDDEWVSTKLASQLRIMNANSSVGAVFSNVTWIDDQGREKERKDVPFFNVFRQPNRSRTAWLRRLTDRGNCLCHPSILIRREVYERCGLYNNCFRQLPDYDMWIRVLEQFDIFVMKQKTVRFRLDATKRNASAVTSSNSYRDINERAMILRRHFKRINVDIFVAAYGAEKSPGDKSFALPLEKAIYLAKRTDRNETMFRTIGSEILYNYLHAEGDASKIIESYSLPADIFHTIMGVSTPWLDMKGRAAFNDKERAFLKREDLPGAEQPAPQQQHQENIFGHYEDREVARSNNRDDVDYDTTDKLLHDLRLQLGKMLGSASWRATVGLRLAKASLFKRSPASGTGAINGSEQSASLVEEALKLQQEIDAVRGSLSWRMTEPARLLDTVYKRLLR